jgi:putative membrane protein
MKKQFAVFLIRWLLNTLGLWVSVRLFADDYGPVQDEAGVWIFLLAGAIFSVINSILRPIIVVLSLPFILITLGLFTLIVNGLMVYISLALTPGLAMTFWDSILTGMVLSLVNYIVSSALELRYEKARRQEDLS